MAKADGAVVDGEQAAAEAGTNGATPAKAKRHVLQITTTEDFDSAFEAKAKAEGKTPAQLARELLAAHVGYTFPPITRTRSVQKYATPEEKKAAQQATSKQRNAAAKALLAALKAGRTGMTLEQIVAEFGGGTLHVPA